jgi:hypothetical protein
VLVLEYPVEAVIIAQKRTGDFEEVLVGRGGADGLAERGELEIDVLKQLFTGIGPGDFLSLRGRTTSPEKWSRERDGVPEEVNRLPNPGYRRILIRAIAGF